MRLAQALQNLADVPGAQGVDLCAAQLDLRRNQGRAATAANLHVIDPDWLFQVLAHGLIGCGARHRSAGLRRLRDIRLPHSGQTDQGQPQQHAILRRTRRLA
ncbi:MULTISPECIES: hypothetical protein [Brevundimonas]|uniref:hypothetical protein n=1 Tax=Brevundimonas TaxID=41275 RepID=UPI0025A6837D|nr:MULTISPECIES: hypothetical protein [Brevundimonas]MDA1321624.1 hypothetical protein [Pseudomonadota bacterium]MDM8351444.1 hypothetical protein [Brevundimonas diminuta]